MKTNFKHLALALLCAFSMQQAMALELIPEKNEKGKWGYVDEMGNKVVDFKYDEADFFTNGLAKVKKGDNYGMINGEGKEVLPVKYNLIEKYNDNIFRIAAGGKVKDGVLMDEKYGFATSDGKEILKPEYEEVGNFTDGLAYIKKGDKYGYINDRIEVVIPCKYNAVGKFNSKGYVWVCEGAKYDGTRSSHFSGGKYGIIDRTGKVIIPVKEKAVGVFAPYEADWKQEYLDKLSWNARNTLTQSGSHHLFRKYTLDYTNFSTIREDAVGFYASSDKNSYKNAVISLSGEVLIKQGKYHSALFPTDGKAVVFDKKSKINYLDMSTGNLLFDKYIDNGWAFQDGVAVVTRNGKQQLIDTKGNSISSSYETIYPRKDGVYIVRSNASGDYLLYGAINAKGQEIIAPENTALYPPSHGLMLCCKNDSKLCGFRATDGSWTIEPKYKDARSFYLGLAHVKTDNGWGLINQEDNEVVKCKWENFIPRNEQGDINGYMWVCPKEENGRQLLHIGSDKLVSTDCYSWVRNPGQDYENVALAGNDDKHIGVITTEGKLVVPCEFDFDQVNTAYKYLLYTGKNNWEEFDTYRVKLYSNPQRNKGNLTDKLESSLWDY